ncbi:MAG: TIM barrel protein [Planctomycetia bacterium]|nr:TIM barrel protein [Planctomycetia bacterium]
MSLKMTRRTLLASAAGVSAAAFINASVLKAEDSTPAEFTKPEGFRGNLKQSVSQWCFASTPIAELMAQCKKIGMVGLDLIQPGDWPTLREAGMVVTMGSMPEITIPVGPNHAENHEKIIAAYEKYIPMAKELGVPNLIALAGNREGQDDATGAKNTIACMKQVMPLAEKYGINIVMELLNTKDHLDYQCDSTVWGVEVCDGVGSDRFKLLYDIYHMQRMEGDIIQTIRKYHQYIGHYHTAGNPGRNDLDDSQELYYPPIIDAIMDTGYTGFLAHEFLPKKGFESLYNAVCLCDR